MASAISTDDLKAKALQFITADPTEQGLDSLIEEALIMADRDLRNVDSLSPLAWDIQPFDGMRTRPQAQISDITQADPGVFTAASVDSAVTGHGFPDNTSDHTSIVVVDGVGGMEELNKRLFLLQYIDATTFSLKTIDGLDALNTTNYTEYDSGGVIYHAGYLLNTTVILANVATKWTFKMPIPHPKLDGVPLSPVTENEVDVGRLYDVSFSGRPDRYRYWQNMTAAGTVSNYIFFYPVCATYYNFGFSYQKEIPDLTFPGTSAVYPFHPPQIHDAIWHGALAKLVGVSKRMSRQNEKVIATQLEVLWAKKWELEWSKDKIKTIELSRRMLGDLGDSSGFSA